jgi:hypothetical protein
VSRGGANILGPCLLVQFFFKKNGPFIHKLLPTQNLLSKYILKSIKTLKSILIKHLKFARKIANYEKREKKRKIKLQNV